MMVNKYTIYDIKKIGEADGTLESFVESLPENEVAEQEDQGRVSLHGFHKPQTESVSSWQLIQSRVFEHK